MSSRSYILQIMLWHQSLKSIHRTLLVFQNKKPNRFEGQNMGGIKEMLSPLCQNMGGIKDMLSPLCQNMGGIKDMLSPLCQNMGGLYHPHPPQDLRPRNGV